MCPKTAATAPTLKISIEMYSMRTMTMVIMNANNGDGEIVDLANQLSSSSEAWIGSSPEATRATFRSNCDESHGDYHDHGDSHDVSNAEYLNHSETLAKANT